MPRDIEDEAARWAVRLDSQSLSPDERQAFDRWLSDDPRHSGALLRAQAGLSLLDQSGILLLEEQACPEPSPRQRRRMLPLGIATLLSAAGAGLAAFILTISAPGTYATEVGEQRRIGLADGSIALINTDSEIRVAFTDRERHISLERGEAWFQVAKDRQRPFLVDAGDVNIRAVGTAFSVRRRDGAAEVVVTEGKVAAWSETKRDKLVPVEKGQKARISAERVETVLPVSDPDPLAWRDGELVLNNTSVAAAAAELNRYNDRKVVIRDSRIANQRLVGLFTTHEPEKFAFAVAQITQSKVKTGRNKIVIYQ